MLSTKVAIDIIYIALVIVAVTITAIVLAQALTHTFSANYLESNSANQAQKTEQNDSFSLKVTDPDASTDPGVDFSRDLIPVAPPAELSPTDQISAAMYESSAYILPITWGAVGGTLIWRGRVRSAWSKQGYDYDTFKLVTRMRGSPTRIRLLNAINNSQKNKLQLAKELDVDWKTIDNHIAMLLHSRLVEEKTIVGTTRYYALTHSGMQVLSLLSQSEIDGGSEVSN